MAGHDEQCARDWAHIHRCTCPERRDARIAELEAEVARLTAQLDVEFEAGMAAEWARCSLKEATRADKDEALDDRRKERQQRADEAARKARGR